MDNMAKYHVGKRTFEGLKEAFVSLVSPSSYIFLGGVASSRGFLVGCVACGVVVVCWVFVLFVLSFASSPGRFSISLTISSS